MAQSHAAAADHLEKLVLSHPQFADMYQKMLEDHGRKSVLLHFTTESKQKFHTSVLAHARVF